MLLPSTLNSYNWNISKLTFLQFIRSLSTLGYRVAQTQRNSKLHFFLNAKPQLSFIEVSA